ncbi:energy-coupling factor transporter transmembrane protein EcfT [Corynebacterium lizhenjunii]|uniref:Energy-coupling factor transporter transmembrane protein EcfT n=1 Tax=Corynebacterium lizhenjunii TaxID=2709394 RepID=A0A7T0KEW3_9CORY|nr:energy-coupling factor transporter transmembrane component T [Corynebacterium lizhenjunii]QPK79520.1 energy-coupling factor transporter transmembrane protein EcfT [Corynebacterium lizhenjunii]
MTTLLNNANPMTRLALMVVLTTPVLMSIDWVSAAVLVVLTVAFAPLCGVSWPQLGRIAWPLAVLAPLSGVSMLLYGRPGGQEYFSLGLITVTENSVSLAVAIMLRVLAVALPVLMLARGMDATALGDALAQVARLPSRFVLGAVAGMRTVSVLRDDWDALALARRARGVADEGRIRRLATMSFGLLVLSLRRGGHLATAMEARGFGRTPPGGRERTWARPSKLGAHDAAVLALGTCVAAVPVVAAVLAGTWRWLGL